MASPTLHPLAPDHLPPFIAAADGSDFLFTFMAVFTVALIVLIGVLYLSLHALPEKMAHESNHSQLQVVGILALLALFTHNNLFWVAAILVAAFRMPDFLTPLNSIADTLMAIYSRLPAASQTVTAQPVTAAPDPAPQPQTAQDAAPKRPET